MLPTPRLVAFALVAALVATLAVFVPGAKIALWALDAAIVLSTALDALLTAGRRVTIERHTGAIFSVGRANAVSLVLHNRTSRTLRGTVMDDPILDATVDGLPARFVLPPRGMASIRYQIVPTRRGARQFGAATVRYAPGLGLLARQERSDLPAPVDVYPDVHAARALELLRRQGRQDARLGSMRVRGGDTEFERLRPYQRGDEVRHMDWRASARRDDFTVRQFQTESNQNIMFAVDIGRSMRGESKGLTTVDHALNAALLAADVALRGGDRAGLMTFDDAPRTFLKPIGGRAGGRKLTRAVYALEAGLAASDYRTALMYLESQLRARSLLVIFTNLLDARSATELSSSVRALMPRHLPLCVMMRDPDVEALAVAPARGTVGHYVRAAAAETLAWRDGLLRSLRNAGVLVLDAAPEDVTPSLVKRYFEIKARRLL